MLVDIPHLLLRMPFLLGKNGASLEAWNYALSSAAQPFGLDADIFSEYFQSKGRIFKATEWLDVTAFWWPTINSDDALSQMFFEASDAINPVFLEDRSLFAANTSDQIREFAAGVDGQWARRHVAGLSKMIYAPRSMFAM